LLKRRVSEPSETTLRCSVTVHSTAADENSDRCSVSVPEHYRRDAKNKDIYLTDDGYLKQDSIHSRSAHVVHCDLQMDFH
jgi:hypothetical protein